MTQTLRDKIADALIEQSEPHIENPTFCADAILSVIAESVEPLDWSDKEIEDCPNGIKLHLGPYSVQLWSGKLGARAEYLGQPILVDMEANGLSLAVKKAINDHHVRRILSALGLSTPEQEKGE